MIFPIGDDNIIGGHKPYISYSLIAINIFIFLYQITLNPEQIEYLLTDLGSIPYEIVHGQDLHTLISSMFLHGGLFHLLGNMLFLWIFADNIEAVVGSTIFAIFYFFGGLFASFVHIITDLDSIIPTVGASGAISAVMGAYLIMFPKSRIKILFIIKTFYVSAFVFLGLWFLQQLVSGIGGMAPQTAEESGGVAWWAHIGGFFYGIILGYIFKQKYKHLYNYSAV